MQGGVIPLARDEHEIKAGGEPMPVEPKGFAEQAFESVAADGVAVFPGNAEAGASHGGGAWESEEQQMGVTRTAAVIVDSLEVRRTFQPQVCGKPETDPFRLHGRLLFELHT